jgi:hypothetical protein
MSVLWKNASNIKNVLGSLEIAIPNNIAIV